MAYNGDGRPVVQRDMSQELVVHTEFHLSEAYHTECEILFFFFLSEIGHNGSLDFGNVRYQRFRVVSRA
jgi:hypothetical protein